MSATIHPGLIDAATRAEIASKVEEGGIAILRKLADEPHRSWTPSELVEVARDAIGALSNTVPAIAFWKLVDTGVLAVDEHMNVTQR